MLGNDYSCIFTDIAGNEERLCYIYKPNKVRLAELIRELAIPPSRKYYLDFPTKNGKKRGWILRALTEPHTSYLGKCRSNAT